MSASDVESGTDLLSSSNSSLPDQERHMEPVVSRNGVREFLVIEHTANVRKNSKISAIWHHGGERPAMTTQCERVFSVARRTLTPERNALGMKIIEACECLRWTRIGRRH